MVKCIKVPKKHASQVLALVKKHGLLNRDYKVSRDEKHVYIPLIDNSYAKIHEVLRDFEYELIDCELEKYRKYRYDYIPSYDLLGNVVIVRENVFANISEDELVKIMLDLHPRIKAIYVKEETVNEYRVPKLRLLWGEEVEWVIVKEYGLRFKVMLGKVYYNKRLSEEHRRIAVTSHDNEKIIDLFSGIGGFSIHIAAMHKTFVIANDLNPYAFLSTIDNIMLNRRKLKGSVIATKMNAVEFMDFSSLRGYFDRLIANLPHRSTEYMHVYDHLLKKNGYLHLYSIGRAPEEILEKLEKYSDKWVFENAVKVLDYAPYIYIYRLDLVKR